MPIFVKNLADCVELIAGDHASIKEIIHPKNDKINPGFSLAYAKVLPDKTTLPHALEQAEVYYILKGTGRMTVNVDTKDVKEKDVIYIPPHNVQYIQNTGKENLEFLCIVCPEWDQKRENVINW